MASVGQIIFWGMIILSFIIGGLLILILCITFIRTQYPFVESLGEFPVGNIGNDVLLDCRFRLSDGRPEPANTVSVTWEKEGLSGVVFQYSNQAAQLSNQNSEFQNRAQIFPDLVPMGNASLLLRIVELRDTGVYRCSVSAASGRGSASVRLTVAGLQDIAPKAIMSSAVKIPLDSVLMDTFSTARFSLQQQTLGVSAQRWFPKPKVSWTDYAGHPLNSSASFFNNSAGIFRVETTLLDPVQNDDNYICLIHNNLVTSVSTATVTDGDVTARTHFIFNSAPMLPPRPLYLILIASFQLWEYRLHT